MNTRLLMFLSVGMLVFGLLLGVLGTGVKDFAAAQRAPISPSPISPPPLTPTQIPSAQAAPTASADGAMVKWVDVPSAANHAGLKAGDVIVAVDGTPVDANHLLADTLKSKKPNDTVVLTILRKGQYLTFTIELREGKENAAESYLGVRFVQGSAPAETR